MWKPILLVVVLGLPIGGFVNYERNEALDQELRNRTYASLRNADLDALVEAYEGQAQVYRARLGDGPQGQELVDGHAAADLDSKVQGFESFQEWNRQWRDTNSKLLEQQAAMDELRREQSIRARGLDTEYGRILRRVITF